MLQTWIEDFVDEDTGEVVSIERNEVILERDTELLEDHIDVIVDAGVKSIILTLKEKEILITRLSTTHFKKIHQTR